MYRIYDVVALGTLFLIVYILIDFFRNKTRNLFKRVIFYSFLFYLINVWQLTLGGIRIPPYPDYRFSIQYVPFYFLWDWYRFYSYNGFDWFFWNSVKLYFYNVLLLMPFGVYISLLFNRKSMKKVLSTVFLVSLSIETCQLTLGYFGIVDGREFDVDDLLLNTLGGWIGYKVMEYIKGIFSNLKNKEGRRVSM